MLLIPYSNFDKKKQTACKPKDKILQNIRRGGPYKLIRQKRRALRHTMRSYLHTSEGRPARAKGPHRLIFRKPNQAALDNVEGGFYIYCYHSLNWGKDRFRSRRFTGQNSLFFVSGVYTRRVFKRRQAVPDTTKRPEGNLSRSFAKLHHCLHVIYALAH